jgi:hypothetical protein
VFTGHGAGGKRGVGAVNNITLPSVVGHMTVQRKFAGLNIVSVDSQSAPNPQLQSIRCRLRIDGVWASLVPGEGASRGRSTSLQRVRPISQIWLQTDGGIIYLLIIDLLIIICHYYFSIIILILFIYLNISWTFAELMGDAYGRSHHDLDPIAAESHCSKYTEISRKGPIE